MVDVRERSKTRTSKYGFFTDVSDCWGNPYNSRTVVTDYEYVSSYRGKRKFVQVGDKRRKMFHPFDRLTYSAGKLTTGVVCEETTCIPNYSYVGTVQEFPWVDFSRPHLDSQWRQTYENVKWSGDLAPLGWYALRTIGEPLRDMCVRDLYAKANAPDWNAAVFLAELDETIVGIYGLFKNCLKSALRMKHLSGNAKHLLLNPEELWLWYRYMLVPTILDVEELIGALKSHEAIDRVQDGTRTEEPEKLSGTLYRLGFGKGCYDIPFRWEAEVTYGVGGAIDILSRHDPSRWGTSAHDVLMGAWERIPFSFLVDWFLNVGDWLASLRSIDVVFAQSYATYAIQGKTKIIDCEPYILDSEPEYTSFRMDRIIDLERPSLPLIDKRWRNLTRTIDLAALTIGMLKGVLKRR